MFIVAAYYTPFPARLLMFYLEHNGHEEGTKVTTPTRKVSERGDAPCNPVINSAELCGLKKAQALIRFAPSELVNGAQRTQWRHKEHNVYSATIVVVRCGLRDPQKFLTHR